MNSNFNLFYSDDYQRATRDIEKKVRDLSNNFDYDDLSFGTNDAPVPYTPEEYKNRIIMIKKMMEEHIIMVIRSFEGTYTLTNQNMVLADQTKLFDIGLFKRQTCPDIWRYVRTEFYDWENDVSILKLQRQDAFKIYESWSKKEKIMFILHNIKPTNGYRMKHYVWWVLHQKPAGLDDFVLSCLNIRRAQNMCSGSVDGVYVMRCGVDNRVAFPTGNLRDEKELGKRSWSNNLARRILYVDNKLKKMSKSALNFKYEQHYKTLKYIDGDETKGRVDYHQRNFLK
jgi:hypothetical protein